VTLSDWFGAKLDVSLDDRGMACIERMSYDAYNESDVLKQKVETIKPELVIIRSV
jgi:hypothetical protein